MENGFMENALKAITSYRNVHAARPEETELGLSIVRQNSILKLEDNDFDKYMDIYEYIRLVTFNCLAKNISNEMANQGRPHEVIFDVDEDCGLLRPIVFAISDYNTRNLYIFKQVMKDNLWKNEGGENTERILQRYKSDKCKYIFLVQDYAYLQIINHNDDESDPGRGHNFYSFKWFWEKEFGSDSYSIFENQFNEYLRGVKEYLSYFCVKSLTPRASIDFRRIVEHDLLTKDYASILIGRFTQSKNIAELDNENFGLIESSFKNELYSIMLGKREFAESFITAEWLYNSMKKAKAIDLTVIGISYFKTIEQLLYSLICLRKDDNPRRNIKKNRSDLTDALCDRTISKKDYLDTTIGSMAHFYEDNLDILSDELSAPAKEYVKKKIFEYVTIRNGYTHKDNIHDWSKIDYIRESTISLIFLLIGSYRFDELEKNEMGIRDKRYFSNFYKLCEYMNFYQNNLFCFEKNDGQKVWVIAYPDDGASMKDGILEYSGEIFFHLLGDPQKRLCKINENGLPQKISLGKLSFGRNDTISINPIIVKTIYEDGKYVALPIWAKDKLDY